MDGFLSCARPSKICHLGRGDTPANCRGSAMSHADAILEYLEAHPGGACDDCISRETGIKPRQQVNQLCRRMEGKRLTRRQDQCPVCGHHKRVNLVQSGTRQGEVPATTDAPPQPRSLSIEALHNWLDRFCKALARERRVAVKTDRLADLISALADRERKIIPPLQAAMMHTIRQLRNAYVHDHIVLGHRELTVAANAWAIICEWAESHEGDLWRRTRDAGGRAT